MSEILPQGDDFELDNKIFNHYNELFKAPQTSPERITLNEFLEDIPPNELKKLNEHDITNLQKSITKSELLLALNRIKENKSSGLNGVSSKLL